MQVIRLHFLRIIKYLIYWCMFGLFLCMPQVVVVYFHPGIVTHWGLITTYLYLHEGIACESNVNSDWRPGRPIKPSEGGITSQGHGIHQYRQTSRHHVQTRSIQIQINNLLFNRCERKTKALKLRAANVVHILGVAVWIISPKDWLEHNAISSSVKLLLSVIQHAIVLRCIVWIWSPSFD